MRLIRWASYDTNSNSRDVLGIGDVLGISVVTRLGACDGNRRDTAQTRSAASKRRLHLDRLGVG